MILLLNHKEEKCGVYQFGKRLADILKGSEKIQLIYRELISEKEYQAILEEIKPTHIIYNWHHYTMSWLKESSIIERPDIQHYFVFHDGIMRQNYTKYLFFGDLDINRNLVPPHKTVLLPRPLFNYGEEPTKNEVFTIGTFGFAFEQKGLGDIIKRVDQEFDQAIINMHIPKPFFDSSTAIYNSFRKIPRKPGIVLNISTGFLTDSEVLDFLNTNDINAFYYYNNGEGLSSATDYALSVKRPIALTNCSMFRHFMHPNMFLEDYSIMEIYEFCMKYPELLDQYRQRWSQKNFLNEIEAQFIDK